MELPSRALFAHLIAPLLAIFCIAGAASAAPPFDPLIYGTMGGPSGALTSYEPAGIQGGVGTGFVSRWQSVGHNGVSGRDLYAPAIPRVGPVRSHVGGDHCSFGQIYGGGNAYLQVVGGSKGVDPADCVVAGVFDAAHGIDSVPTLMVIFEVGYGQLGLRISPDRFLEVYGDLGSFITDIRPTAGPMAFALWSTADGVRLVCANHTPVTVGQPISSHLDQSSFVSKLLVVGASSGAGYGFKGGVRALHFWDKHHGGGGDWSADQLSSAADALATSFDVPPPTDLLIVAGDSYGAGYKLFGGESIAQWLAADRPTMRVINLAQAGAVANDPTHALPDVAHDQLPHIVDPRNTDGFTPQSRTVIIFDGHNEIWAQHPSTETYIASRLDYTTALEAAGFRVIWADINPISVLGSSDAAVSVYESRRRAYRSAIAAAQTTATRLTYCDTAPGLDTGSGTPAEVRLVTRGECYYNPQELLPAGTETWALNGWSDELHMGAIGWTRIHPYVLAALDGQPVTGVCCIGAVCALQSASDCASANGRFGAIGASCDSNPCVGACCNSTTFECAIVPLGQCGFAAWTSAGSCAATPCQSGACCSPLGLCAVTAQTLCTAPSTWIAGAACQTFSCPPPPPTGTCCTPAGTCTLTTQADCAGPSSWTTGATCESSPCPPPTTGTCCSPTAVCSLTLQADCASQGTWTTGATCDASPCPPLPPTGTCCTPTALCSLNAQSDCAASSTWTANTTCDSSPCPPPPTGACCTSAACTLASAAECAPDAFHGPGSTCGTSNNPTTCCRANFNQTGGLSVQDIFDFLSAWFDGAPSADFNGNGLAVSDVMDFLNAWFAGC